MKNKSQLDELNRLLSNKSLDLPDHRRIVTDNGSNFEWLSKNIGKRNKDIDVRLKEMLSLKFHNIGK